MSCRTHGLDFWSKVEGAARGYCKKCNYDRVKKRRHRVKALLVAEAGGKCVRCGYDKCVRALDFHHVDPSTKSFAISAQTSISLDRVRAEAAKCILLCRNCHAEVEACYTEDYSHDRHLRHPTTAT